MCSQQSVICTHIMSDQLKIPAKVKQARNLVRNKGYEFILTDNTSLTIKPFKSEQGANRVKELVQDILDNMCENLCGEVALDCSELYNCCDCGGNNCGCAYCWSCNACDECQSED